MSSSTVPPAEHFGRFAILMAERRLHVDGQPVALGSRAFDLLAALVARRDRVVPKDELIDVVWPGLVVEDNNLQVQISALRKVLGAQAIATVPGRGYQFTVAAASADPLPEAQGDAGGATPRMARLLVADDNKVNRLLLCRSLALMGHEVASADDGRATLERLRGERYDLLLLDLEMPEIDGFAVLERRAADPALRELPVIVTSSLEGVAHVARCIELGADDFLHKPVNTVLLKARVDSSLERKRLRDRERELLARLASGVPYGGQAVTSGRRIEATVLAARLQDVEARALFLPAHETLEWLSNWSTLMLDAIEGHGGQVLEFTGGAIRACFDATQAGPEGDAPWAAVRAALEMIELTGAFDRESAPAGHAPIALRIGIATGEVLVGEAGTLRHAVQVCVGPAAQRATELAGSATQPGHSALIDSLTHAAVSGRVPTDPANGAARPGSGATEPAYALKVT